MITRRMLLMVVAVLLSGAEAQAVIISPTVLEIDSQSSGQSQVIVSNNTTQITPIEASLRRLVFQGGGEFVAQDVIDSQLMVFPPAAMIKPGQSQVFRLQWIGDDSSAQSESYFLRFSQPSLVATQGSQSGIAVQIHYNAIIHVFSPEQAPNVEMQVTNSGEAVVKNSGNRYTYLSLTKFLPAEESATEFGLTRVEMMTSLGEHFLPPFSSIELPSNSLLKPGVYQGVQQ
ncbi:fimbrial biogenesis chaperone [Vibrio cortegadensis]|uniref:Molecular chaperone n=1 Tax=Vibrio cortegadensis TaxID=1328770 RepID=A0ABV4M2Z9_9VIBR